MTNNNQADQKSNNLASFIWTVADLLRGDFKQSQYGRIILPFTLLRRLECVLAPTQEKVLAAVEKSEGANDKIRERNLIKASGNKFYNTSKMNLSKLGQLDIKDNLISYILSFSKDAREIFEYFDFTKFINDLDDADLLYKTLTKFANIDLSPTKVEPHDMGLVFEELIRKFAESANDTAGEHFTPRDIVELTTALVFMEDDELLSQDAVIRTIYDPTAGTGGFLSAGSDYVKKLNPEAIIKTFGQELNPESYAICKGDMLIKGQPVDQIKLGNTLSNDQLANNKFDYMLSNPPFGVKWEKIAEDILKEHNSGDKGRFSPGLPRISDGSLLFLMHLLSKLRDKKDGGGRIGIILNGSPLFTGGAGSGESEIRRYILENDLLEAIVSLPTDMFYNTGIATYVWVLSNKKLEERVGKVQLINGINLCSKMRKSLGAKRHIMNAEDIATITRTFRACEVVETTTLDKLGFKKTVEQKSNRGRPSENPKTEELKTFASKVFDTHEFGYRRITIERPLRESYHFSDERIAELRFAPKPLNAPMKWIYETFASTWSDSDNCEKYGELDSHMDVIRKHFKEHFKDIKEAKIKELLKRDIWLEQRQILLKAKKLQVDSPQGMGTEQCDDMNGYETRLKAACKEQDIDLEPKEKKQVTSAVSWKNPAAKKIVKKVHKNTIANPIYGLFTGKGKNLGNAIEYKADGDLRDFENVKLNPSQSVDKLNEIYFKKEVQPHVPDAWIDANKKDLLDNKIGIVGYEIPITRHFYEYVPPRDLDKIDDELDIVSKSIVKLIQEVQV
jgi:type I restriction enzyme M protein